MAVLSEKIIDEVFALTGVPRDVIVKDQRGYTGSAIEVDRKRRIAAKQVACMAMSMGGMTHGQIAKRLGYNHPSGVGMAIRTAKAGGSDSILCAPAADAARMVLKAAAKR